MNRKLLFLEDLYNFYKNNEIQKFSAADNNGEPLYVQVHGTVDFSASDDENSEGLLRPHIKACHIDENINHSYIENLVMEKAMSSLPNRPLLGFLHKVNDQWEFYGHNMTVDEDGNIEYQEIPIGHFPESCNPTLKYDDEQDKTYVEADAIVYEDYTHAAEVLKREGTCSVSVELAVKELAYSPQDKLLYINDFIFNGCTVLGKDEDGNIVKPGMVGSNITLEDFSRENNSMFSESALVETLNKLNDTLNKFQIKEIQEGGKCPVKLEELLSKYNVTIEDLTFDTDGLTDEELEAKFAEVFNKEPVPENDPESTTKEFSVKVNDSTYTFEVALDEVIYALEKVVNESYSEQDNAYYGVKVYDKYLVMIDYWTGKAYKQNYKERKGVYSLSGDRVEVFAKYLTKEEENELDKMRANYSEMETALNKYEQEKEDAAKTATFESEDYGCIKDSEEFQELKNSAGEYSAKEIQEKCDSLLLEYVKSSHKTFNASPARNIKVNIGASKSADYSPYGTLFANK